MPRPGDANIIKVLANAVEQGYPLSVAATLAGIGATTAHDWLADGNAELAAAPRGTPLNEVGSHAELAWAINAAQAAFVVRNVDIVNEHAAQPKGWLPAMTLLERRMPRDFGRNERLEIEQRTVTLVTTYDQLPPAQREALIALLGGTTDDNSEPATLALPPPSDTNDNA